MDRYVSDNEDYLLSSTAEEEIEKSTDAGRQSRAEKPSRSEQRNLAERPTPLGEDVSLSLSTETAKQPVPPNTAIVNRVFKVAFLG